LYFALYVNDRRDDVEPRFRLHIARRRRVRISLITVERKHRAVHVASVTLDAFARRVRTHHAPRVVVPAMRHRDVRKPFQQLVVRKRSERKLSVVFLFRQPPLAGVRICGKVLLHFVSSSSRFLRRRSRARGFVFFDRRGVFRPLRPRRSLARVALRRFERRALRRARSLSFQASRLPAPTHV
jgi:hypothetical protein